MAQRRAIACTICAKAKTKCDKACEPRSTRRTSDSNYPRQTKNKMVSPKRYPSTNSIPTMSRHGSPRSVPSSNGHLLVRAASQMDMATAVKLGHQPDFNSMHMLTPLPTFSPQIIDGCYSDFGSPEQGLAVFPHQMDKTSFISSGRLTPQTPESFTYGEPLTTDPFEPYMNPQAWSDDGAMPIGLGFENEIPGLIPNEADMRMWSQDVDGNSTPMGQMRTFESPVCESPSSINAWPSQSLSASPPQLPHTRAVPSLSISEYSAPDSDSPSGVQDEWTTFRCNANIPSTSVNYYDGIKAIPNNHPQIWEESMLSRTFSKAASDKFLNLDSIEDSLRVSVMDVANGFIQQARQLSKSARLSPPSLPARTSPGGVDGSLPTPSATAVETLLRSYSARFEPFYPTFAAKQMDIANLLQSDMHKLHLLLIVAAGASATPTSLFTNILIEPVRILLDDFTAKDVSLWRQPVTLRTALLYMNIALWTDEKWHTGAALSQSTSYFQMVRRSGFLAYREKSFPELGPEISWQKWRDHEALNRLVYSWVIADQELSLFYDKAPTFCTTELTAALPDQESLWQATSADAWSSANPSRTNTPPSLQDLFKRLMSHTLVNDPRGPTRFQLRLLLHPLQALVHEIHQRIASSTIDLPENHLAHMREVQEILGGWYTLACRRMQAEGQICPVLLSNFIIFHLISLKSMTNIPEVESLARGEGTREQFMATTWARTQALGSAQRIWNHCGQIVRLIRLLPGSHRPLWIPAVVYRVCLLLWSTSIAKPPIRSTHATVTQFSGPVFAIDSVSPHDETLVRYLSFGQGTPMLSLRNGVWFSLTSSPVDMLTYCIELIKEEELNTKFGLGIRNRLELLRKSVKSLSPVF
ncbi:uncharacterized protein BDR25DRAFT_309604 [Lindgomyces ingoldianus]|uniref:Uncharacterized protein n=1 Tax=Lindgomyces ingoldianus TaxID=673940 RepID=A0ACB6RAS8_9PLEO|nr:uncharacterized protein BDR25DRAFT_309604 [Lindgomyces ingoldianus]KAF2476160.1 hypothetical protein BDR25DRAFT_309604 [Lindgomyces ingoldianus]